MACNLMGCSCSMCPYCATEHCPKYNEEHPRYWIYITDHMGGYLIPFLKTDDRSKIAKTVESFKNRKSWAKKYLSRTIRNTQGDYERILTDEIEITITDGECNWYTDIRLILNTNTKTITNTRNNKEWSGNIIFRKRN